MPYQPAQNWQNERKDILTTKYLFTIHTISIMQDNKFLGSGSLDCLRFLRRFSRIWNSLEYLLQNDAILLCVVQSPEIISSMKLLFS